MARDVEIAIRDHDYAEAMRRLHESMGTRAGRRKLSNGLWLLLRPSVAIAAAIMEDATALDEIAELTRAFVDDNDSSDELMGKVEANRKIMGMVRWLREEVRSQGSVPRSVLDSDARTHGYRSVSQAMRMLERHGELFEESGVVHSGRRPIDPATAAVPYFKTFMSTRDDLDEEQEAFYSTVFTPAFLRGDRVELGESISYGFVLFNEVCAQQGYDDLGYLRSLALRARDFYPETALARHATNWIADTYFLEGDYQSGYDVLAAAGNVPLGTYIGVADQLVDSRITGQMAWEWTTAQRLRSYGVAHKEAVLVEVERLLDEKHQENGQSIVLKLWQEMTAQRTVDPLPPGTENAPGRYSQELHFMKHYGGRGTTSFRGIVGSESPQIHWPSEDARALEEFSTYGFHHVVRDHLHEVFQQAENNVRENAGVPRIGEGWVSEVELFHQLREAFPDTRVIHQGRPRWLGRQSIDVLLPEWRIAIEYQGEQHVRPVEIFGGAAAFATQQERDQRKRQLCAENDHTLIEVFPGYDLAEVVAQIIHAQR